MKKINNLVILLILTLTQTHLVKPMELEDVPTAKERAQLLFDALPQRQPESLKNQVAKIAFVIIPQSEHPKTLLQTLPKELVAEYINKPVDRAQRTPLYYANTQQQVEELTDELEKYNEHKYYDDKNILDGDTPFNAALKYNKKDAAQMLYKKKYFCGDQFNHQSGINIIQKIVGKEIGSLFRMVGRLRSDGDFIAFHRDNNELEHKVRDILAQEDFCSPEQMGRNGFFYLINSQNVLDDIQKLSEQGVDINHQDKWNNTPLIYSLKCLRPDITAALFNAGADALLCDEVGRNGLSYAIILRYNFLIQFLILKFRVDFSAFDKTYTSLLELAAEYNVDIVHTLLQMFDLKPENLNLALKKAAHCNHEAIGLLIAAGADVNTQCGKNIDRSKNEVMYTQAGKSTPLMVAAGHGNCVAVRKLLAHGADPNIKRQKKSGRGYCALGHAVGRYNNAIIPDLIEKGANINDIHGDWYILLDAAGGNAAAIHCLLNAPGQQLQVNVQDANDGSSALSKLLLDNEEDSEEVIISAFQALITAGIDINLRDRSGETVLYTLAYRYRPDQSMMKNYCINNNYLQLVLDSGADCNISDNNVGDTPLLNLFQEMNFRYDFLKCNSNYYNIDEIIKSFQLLLKAGADSTLRNNKDQTVLHKAVLTAQPRLVQFLLEQGIDYDVKDNNGNTPLMVAREHCDKLDKHLQEVIQKDPTLSSIQANIKERYKEINEMLESKIL